MVSLLLKTIQSKEDEIVIFYACKTIENITAQSINAGTKFASLDFVTALHSIYTTTKNEALKVCAVVCLGHIARLNGSLIWKIIEKFSVRHICSSFSESNARIQQVYIQFFFLIPRPSSPCSTNYCIQEVIKYMLSSLKKRT